MPETLEIQPVTRPLKARIRPPGSKSITNRALVCAALADSASTLRGALDSEDTQVMIAALRKLGINIEARDGGRTLHVDGCNGVLPAGGSELFVANSGTTMRFLTALVALGRGEFRLDGVQRMRERPMGDMASVLQQLGVQLRCESPNDCPPVVVNAHGLRGGKATIGGGASSQFLSGAMMAAPYANEQVELTVAGPLVSVPYVQMTRRVMEAFGADVVATADYREQRVSNSQRYRGRDYVVEPDASAASYFFAAAAIAGGEVTVEGVTRSSLQGDVAFCSCLQQMGAVVVECSEAITVQGRPLHGIDVDMNAISDTVPTLAVAALFAEGPTRIRNVAHVRHKETDRIAAVARELRKLGAEAEEHPDGLSIQPGKLRPATIDTYDDHRMAMSFALAGLRVQGVVIRDPQCTGKTYPDFFADLDRVAHASA
jgi:3-phosphoshikimate 1-carboxyvinyltransferase